MAGQIHRMIDSLINQRSKGDSTLKMIAATKLILKGVDPDDFNSGSPDDPTIIAKLQAVGIEWGFKP